MSIGDFVRNPDRRARLLVITQGIWVSTLLVLMIWWVTLLKQQSGEIASLETQLGVSEPLIQARQFKLARMVTGESVTFVLLIFITNGILVYLFIRDHRRSRSIQTFFASLTHELRTPLTSIKLQAESLRDIEDNPKHTPFIERLLEDVERLEGQVQQTLELARLEGGGNLALQPIPLLPFIRNKVFALYENAPHRVQFHLMQSPGISTERQANNSAIHIEADPIALLMVFRNSIDNAIKYSKNLPARISFQEELLGQELKLSLIHHNAFFNADEKQLGRLFYRGKNSQGAGVGLYLIQSLMRKMNGNATFAAESEQFVTQLTFQCEQGSEHE